jgi:hypothetical protein
MNPDSAVPAEADPPLAEMGLISEEFNSFEKFISFNTF